jgi:hypothetical protein
MTLTMARVDQRGAWVCADRRQICEAEGWTRDRGKKIFAFALAGGHILGTVAGFLPGPHESLAWYETVERGLPFDVARDEMLEAFRSRMEASFQQISTKIALGLSLTLVGFWHGEPLFYCIENWGHLSRFEIRSVPWQECDLVRGGYASAVSDQEVAELAKKLRSGASPAQKVRALAALNRAASQRDESEGTVSPECIVAFWSPEPGSFPLQWSVDADGRMTPAPFVVAQVPQRPVGGDSVTRIAGSGENIITLTRPNDGRRVKLWAFHRKAGYADSPLTDPVILDPWETTATVPGEASDAEYVLASAVPASLPNGRRLVDGTNTEVDTATDDEIKVNLAGLIASGFFAGTPGEGAVLSIVDGVPTWVAVSTGTLVGFGTQFGEGFGID